MSKIKKLAASPAVTVGALALAVILLAFSAIGGTRAALTYYSENYVSTVQMHELGVSLVENGKVVASGNAATSANARADAGVEIAPLLAKGNLILKGAEEPEADTEPFKPGAVYREELAVRNATDSEASAANGASNITQYVRVTIQRYWLKPDGKDANGKTLWTKSSELDPALIDLHLVTGNGWVEDPQASTAERTVLYYTRPLEPGSTTPIFADTLCVDKSVLVTVRQDQAEGGTVTNTYVYNNASFQLEVKVDAVQNHNVADAILSAWGRTVTVDAEGTLSLS